MGTQIQELNVLVTGGGGDIAKALLQKLEPDFKVVAPSRKELDVTDPQQVDRYVGKLKVDIVVNNAGSIHPKEIHDSDPSLWRKDIEVKIFGAYHVSRALLKANRSVRIINISSTAAFATYKDWSSYCIANYGLVAMTKALSLSGFDAVCLCPGAIETKFRDSLYLDNPNVMSLDEATQPILKAVAGRYNSGDVILYRKGEGEINCRDKALF